MNRQVFLLSALAIGGFFPSPAAAQPILNRVEKLLRDQIGAPRAAGRTVEPGYVGITADDRQDEGRGLRVTEVNPDGPAAAAGLQVNDLITAIDAQEVRAMQDMARALGDKPAGTKITFTVERNGAPQEVAVTLGRRPPRAPAPDAPPAGGPRLGIRSLPVSEEARRQNNLPNPFGALVNSVSPFSPAERAGIPVGAIITAVDGQPVDSPEELAAAVRNAARGEIELTCIVRGEETRKRVTLAGGPAPPEAQPLPPRPAPPSQLPSPSAGPVLAPPGDQRTAELEARVRELEQRVEKLEQMLAREPGEPASQP